MSDKYQELREALAAGPQDGPWSYRGTLGPISAPHLKGPCVVERPDGTSLAHMTGWRDNQQRSDAAYIAAASPDAIAALLAERDALAKEVLRLRVAAAKAAQRAEGWTDSNDDPADCLADCASILYDALDVRHVRNAAAMEAGNE